MNKIGMSTILIMVLLLSGCSGGGGGGSSTQSTDVSSVSKAFDYETQGSVNISVTAPLPSTIDQGTIDQAQILLYESQKLITTPVGDSLVFDNLIREGTIISSNYTTTVTLGNHIDSIWIVIPVLGYEKEHNITDNTININLTQGL